MALTPQTFEGIAPMDLDQLNKMWAEDCKLDEANVSYEARRVPELHNKYYHLYAKAGLKVKKLKSDLAELTKAKTEYYLGSMDQAELKQRGWKPNALIIPRSDIAKYIDSDKDVIDLSLTIDYHLTIAEYLEDIVKQINTRNFLLTNIVNWERFRAGSI
jgi:hypothetical protein